jgi:adenylylsulfate kinase
MVDSRRPVPTVRPLPGATRTSLRQARVRATATARHQHDNREQQFGKQVTVMAEQIATNVHWHEGDISREHREKLLGHRGATIWFTGLSGSGKSTIAVELEGMLHERGVLAYRLDGDNVRMGINKNLGFSAKDRAENIRRVGEVAKLFADAGVIALSSFISPYVADRDGVRALHEAAGIDFIEVFVDCSLEAAEARDPKGLYKKARAGEIRNFTGIDDPYEAPPTPELHLHSDRQSLEEEIAALFGLLEQRGIIPARA